MHSSFLKTLIGFSLGILTIGFVVYASSGVSVIAPWSVIIRIVFAFVLGTIAALMLKRIPQYSLGVLIASIAFLLPHLLIFGIILLTGNLMNP